MKYKIITAALKARTAVHIGSGEGSDTTDALIRRDATGNPLIPGTAIAGALRSLLTRLAPRMGSKACAALTASNDPCDCSVCRLFGDVNPSHEEASSSAASRLLVFNARLTNKLRRTFIRDGVGIDRATGAAARAGRVKFDLEVLPAGAEFELRMELRNSGLAGEPEDERLLAATLAQWQAGRVWLGGRVARGLGAFELKDVQFKTLDLDSPERLVAFLKADTPWIQAAAQESWLDKQIKAITISSLQDADEKAQSLIARRWVRFEGILQAEGPLLTNDATASGLVGFDHAPLLAQLGDWQQPTLSGAGLRGVLRSHAERIARTLATHAADGLETFKRCCPACSPVESRPEAPLASCDTLLRGKVSTNDEVSTEQLCLACRLFGSARRGSRLVVEDAPYQKTESQPKPVLKMLDFLAIDRSTGGGAEGAKFDALALWKPAFKLRLYLDNPETWELGWLALVLRDMAEGWLHVGMGAAKGFGRVRLADLRRTLGYLLPSDITDLWLEAQGQRNGSLYTEMDFTLIPQTWVTAFREQVARFERGADKVPLLRSDSYFDDKVEHLYRER